MDERLKSAIAREPPCQCQIPLSETEPDDPPAAIKKSPAGQTEGVGQFFLKDFTKLPALKRLTGPHVAWDDPNLIKLIREELIDTPRPTLSKISYPLFETPQAKAVDKILKKMVQYLLREQRSLKNYD